MTADSQDDAVTATGERRPNLWQRIFGAKRRSRPDDAVPTRIGRYRVIEILGEGGMGRVFAAEDETLQRRVAVKVLKEWDESSHRRFLREARAAARISHPNVCPIFEVGEEGGRPFLATELLSGETLAKRLQRGPLSTDEALDLARDMLAALEALHEAGIVHRDVKPSNVFLTSHGAKLLDFGLARDVPRGFAEALASGGDFTKPGLLIGTPGYMAPEQILGHPVDERADLFAAGVVFYEALVGRRPFGGESAVQVLSAVLHEEPSTLAGTPFEAFDASLRRALSKPPERRYDSARDMMDALHTTARAAQARVRTGARTREPFVGRQDELAWLEERLAAAVAGEGSVAFVTGERGVGKSTLVAEFLRRVSSEPGRVSLAAGRCVEAEGPGEAFLPLQDAVGRILMSRGRERTLELLRTYAPTLCLQFRTVLIPDPDGALQREAVGATKERFLREAGDFMEATSREFPVVLYLEDLQWADAASVELLHHLGCRIARQRTLVIGTFRHADVDAANPPLKRCAVDLIARGAGRELALGALSSEDLQSYLDARFEGHRFPPPLAGILHERTEGLALFARSLVDLLLERGDIARDAGTWGLARPAEKLDLAPTKGLRELVRQHIEALPAEKRELLQHASVAGREFLSPVVAHTVVGDIAVVEEHLRGLCDIRRLIMSRGEEELPDGTLATRYRFAHGLYQAVLYQELVASRRVELHRKMARRLQHHWGSEAPRLATEIAQHCEHGRDFTGAVRFRLGAGDNAARIYAHDEAAEHYEWASRSIEKLAPDDRPEWRLALHQKRGVLRHTQARFDEAVSDFEAMLEGARRVGSAESERVALSRLCDALFYARRVEEMAVRAQELLDIATRGGDPSDLVTARSRLAQVLTSEGRLAEAIPLLDRVIEDARKTGPPDALQIALSHRGALHYWQTEYGAAEAVMSDAVTVATDCGDAFTVLMARMFVGLARVKLGRISEGILEFLEGIKLARRNADRFWLPRLVIRLGWTHREVLAQERALEFSAEALRLTRENPLPQAPVTEALLDLAVDEARLGHVERATELLTDLEARVAEDPWLRWMNELRLAAAAAEHWMACGDPDRAAEHAGRLLGLARRLKARDYQSTAERLRAEVALARGESVEEAARRLAEALEELRRFPAPFEMWRSARLLGQLRRRLGDEEGAGRAFSEAAEAVRTIAAGITDEALRDGFLGAPAVREVLEAAPEA
jgi:tetratricopeptide (TPR) repeat protein